MTTESDRLTPAQLRTCSCSSPSIRGSWSGWPSAAGSSSVPVAPSCTARRAGTCFFVLVRGAVALSRQVRGDDVEVSRTDQRGVYGGAVQAYLGDQVDQIYRNSMRALVDSDFFVLPAEDFAHALRSWFPMPMHLLEGLFLGLRNSQTIVGERERLLALGSLSAG
ncbi:hypothetical protein NKG94_11410 [Micromonospora sp. M12]